MMVMKSTLSIIIIVVTKILLRSACWMLTLSTPAVVIASDAGGLASSPGSTSSNAPVGTEGAKPEASITKVKTQLQQLNDYVSSIGETLIAASDYPDESFSFKVWADPVVNAIISYKEKSIGISTGLLMRLNSEEELVAVLSHELMHSFRRHGERAERREKLKGALGSAAAMLLGGTYDSQREILGAMRDVNALAFTQFDQNQEYEADLYGAELLVKAGYSPAGVVDALNMMNAMSSLEFKHSRLEGRLNKEPRSFVRSHPPTPERLSRAKQLVDDLRDHESESKHV